MHKPDLSAPLPEAETGHELRPRELAQWAKLLAVAGGAEIAAEALAKLRRLAAADLAPEDRLQGLLIVHQAVVRIVAVNRKTYVEAALPLGELAELLALRSQQLFEALAMGALRVLRERLRLDPLERAVTTTGAGTGAGTGTAAVPADELAQDALCFALYAVHRWLLESYAAYAPMPVATWALANGLYGFAERALWHLAPVSPALEALGISGIANLYKHMLLLSLTNPHHLMSGEADEVEYWLRVHMAETGLQAPADSSQLKGGFAIDLAGEQPPQYISARNLPAAPGAWRRIDIQPVLNEINGERKRLEHARALDSLAFNLNQRQDLERHTRVHWALAARTERLSMRNAAVQEIQLAIGLRACHHSIAGDAPFQPEQDELAIQGRRIKMSPAKAGSQPTVGDMLLPAPTRTSRFEGGGEARDVWKKIYAPRGSGWDGAPELQPAELECRIERWRQRNTSLGGLSLYSLGMEPDRIRVGEIVGLQQAQDSPDAWQIGVVRWLMSREHGGLMIGVLTLAADAAPVATRAVRGTGRGSEYLRGLILPKVDPRAAAATLLVPAAIYDIDTVLLINRGKDIFSVRLRRLMSSSSTYNRFRFEVLDG